MIAIVLGFVVAMTPGGWMTVITDVAWEQSIISMTALAGAGLAAALPWAHVEGGQLARRARLWVLVLGVTATIYVVSVSPVFLVAAFCTAFVGMLDLWMARAHFEARGLRSRLEDTGR